MGSVLEALNNCLSGADKKRVPYKNFDSINEGAYWVTHFRFDEGSKYGPKVCAVTEEFQINLPKRATERFVSREAVDALNMEGPQVMIFHGKDRARGGLVRVRFINPNNPEATKYNIVGLPVKHKLNIKRVGEDVIDSLIELHNY
jgi:hypothetical protein